MGERKAELVGPCFINNIDDVYSGEGEEDWLLEQWTWDAKWIAYLGADSLNIG